MANFGRRFITDHLYDETMAKAGWEYRDDLPVGDHCYGFDHDEKPKRYHENYATTLSTPSLGASFVVGLKVLARNYSDGYFYFGRICRGGQKHIFQVEFEDPSNIQGFLSIQDTNIKDIVAFDDAFHHDINMSDHVLCPVSPVTPNGCFVPGIVIDGCEKRRDLNAVQTNSTVIVKTVDKQIIHVKPGTAIWISQALYERFFGKDEKYKKTEKSFVDTTFTPQQLDVFDSNRRRRKLKHSVDEYGDERDELRARIDKQIYQTEKLLMDLQLRQKNDGSCRTNNVHFSESRPKLLRVNSQIPMDDIEWDSGVASDRDDDEGDYVNRRSKDFQRGRVILRAPVYPVVSTWFPKEESEKIKAKRSQFLKQDKFDDSVKVVPARTAWVAKWEKRDKTQKEAEEKAEQERLEKAAIDEKEAVERAEALARKEKKKKKEKKERKKQEQLEIKERLETMEKKLMDKEKCAKEMQKKFNRKLQSRVHVDVARKKTVAYRPQVFQSNEKKKLNKSMLVKQESPHIPAKEYHSFDGTPIPKSQDRRFLTKVNHDHNWSPEKLTAISEVPLDIITHRPKSTYDRHKMNSRKRLTVGFSQDTRHTEEGNLVKVTGNSNLAERTVREEREDMVELRRLKAQEKDLERRQNKHLIQEKRIRKQKEAEEKAQRWKHSRLDAIRSRREKLVQEIEDKDVQRQTEKNSQLEELTKLEIEKSKELANKMEREITEQEKRLKTLRHLRRNQLEKEDRRTKNAFEARDLKAHTGDQNIQYYRASILP